MITSMPVHCRAITLRCPRYTRRAADMPDTRRMQPRQPLRLFRYAVTPSAAADTCNAPLRAFALLPP